jgi:predicted metallopeptidase
MRWEKAPDVQELINNAVYRLDLKHIVVERVVALRSYGSKSRAIARIWEMPRAWQVAFDMKPAYAIEVISDRYDKLPLEEREKTVIHELLHIPKTFSGALVPHKCFGEVRVGEKAVRLLHDRYKGDKQ